MRGLPEFGGEYPVAALAEEILTEGDGQIRAMLTVAGNPVLSTPNGKQLDRAFGSLEPEGERCVYGLTKNIETYNPVRVAFHEYAAIWRDAVAARGWRRRAAFVFASPGWAYANSEGRADPGPLGAAHP